MEQKGGFIVTLRSKGITASMRRALDSTPLVAGLSEEERLELWLALPAPEWFDKDASLYTQHAFRNALGLVAAGEAQVFRVGTDGRRSAMTRLRPGSLFGAAALFGGGESYVTDVVAKTRCAVVFLPEPQLVALLQSDWRLCENYLRFLTGRVRFLNQRIDGFTGGQAEERLLWFLCRHSDSEGRVELPCPLTALAQLLDIGRSSLYRSLRELSDQGVLRRDGKTITILQRREDT